MSPTQAQTVQQILAATTQALKAGDLAVADAALAPFFRGQVPGGPDLFNLAGTLRMHQGRMEDAAGLFGQAANGAPREPIFTYNLALALSRLGRAEEAEKSFRTTLLLQGRGGHYPPCAGAGTGRCACRACSGGHPAGRRASGRG